MGTQKQSRKAPKSKLKSKVKKRLAKRARDAVSGEFTTLETAKENPSTTVVETVNGNGGAK